MKFRRSIRTLILRPILFSALIGLSACTRNTSTQETVSVAQEISQNPFSPELEDWPHINSDLKPDKRVHFGRMSNGLRYAILPIPDKQGTVSLQMNIAVGFNDEPTDAYGVAHILEHMAFRGARTDNEGSIIHELETMGAQHGRDINGYTYPDHTLYIVNLPTNERKPIEAALQNMSRLAIQPNLSEDNLSLEKGVVIAEMNLRNTIQARAYLSSLSFENPSNPRNKVQGIGTKESIKEMSLAAVRQFHDTHYRPENTLLTIVGDVKVAHIERLLKNHFFKWSPKTQAVLEHPNTEILELEDLPNRASFEEKGSLTEVHAIENLSSTKANDTLSFRQKIFAERIAISILKLRLKQSISDDPTVKWINPFYTRKPNYDLRGVKMGASDYAKAMTYFEEERLRILKFGFTEDEINFALKKQRAILENLAEQPDKIKAWQEASQLRNSFINGRVYLSHAQYLEQHFELFTRKLDIDDFNQAAVSNWRDFRPRFWSQSNKSSAIPIEELSAIIEDLSDQKVDQPSTNKPVTFAPSPSLLSGQVRSRDTISSGKLHRLLYENGSRLNYQQSDKEPDNIEISVTLNGDLESFVERYNSVGFRASALSRADIKGISKLEMDRALTGQKADFRVNLVEGKIVISSSTRPRDLETALNLIATFIADVDYNSKHQQELFEQRKKRSQKDRHTSPVRATDLVLHYEYSGKSPSFYPTNFSERPNTKRDLKKIISEGAIEVGVSGDFEPNVLEEIFANTFGGLPSRKSTDPSKMKNYEGITSLKKGLSSLTYRGTDKQMALTYCWPLEPSSDTEDVIAQAINGQILHNRIVARLRGDRGITYSPQSHYLANSVFPNFKFNCFTVQIEPEDELTAHDNFFDVVNGLHTEPVSKTELNRVREPAQTAMEKHVNSNGATAYFLASAYSEPENISEHFQAPSLLKNLKLKTVQERIKTQFDLEKLHIFRTQHYQSSRALERVTLKVKSHLGDIDAQLKLGTQLILSPTNADKILGIETLNQAFEKGSLSAALVLGKHYATQEKDLKKAEKYLKPASDTKDGAFQLGHLYFRNFEIFPDISDERIIELLTTSAEKGSAHGQYMLAERLKDGTLVERDEIGALKWALISNYTRRGEASIIDEKGKYRFITGMTEDDIKKAHMDANAWIKEKSP